MDRKGRNQLETSAIECRVKQIVNSVSYDTLLLLQENIGEEQLLKAYQK